MEPRALQALGLCLIVIGILANRYTLGFFSADGSISGPIFNAAIFGFEALCLLVGITLLRRPRYATLLSLCMLGVSTLVSLGLVEVGLRLFVYGPVGLSPRGMYSMEWLSNRDLLVASDVDTIVYELRPNLDAMHAGIALVTNEQGMCDDPLPEARPNTAFRVAAIGDSFTMASGVVPEETWHQQLEAELATALPDREVRCLNYGVAGYQLPQYLGVLNAKVAPQEPDLIVVGFCAENDQEATLLPAMRTLLEPRPRPFFLKRVLIVQLLSRMNFAPHYRMDKTPTPEESQFIDTHFAAFAAYAAEHNTPVVIAFLANLPRPSEAVAALARKHGLPFIDTAQDFRVTDLRANSTYHPLDSHPNARAHGIFASKIHAYLSESGLLPTAPTE